MAAALVAIGATAANMAIAFFSIIPYPLSTIVVGLVQFYVILIIAWAILSWFNPGRGGFISELYGVLDKIVSPYIDLFRRFIPTAGGIDFSPLVAIILLQVLLRLLV
ncbi:MAG: YggT family protein [Coriobacteriales bacterium]|nr:YggT family protein [Coriobacteriales bacterium]